MRYELDEYNDRHDDTDLGLPPTLYDDDPPDWLGEDEDDPYDDTDDIYEDELDMRQTQLGFDLWP